MINLNDTVARISFKIKNFFLGEDFYLKSYSQEGEDMLLNRIFSSKKKGFYIDIGAHHPKRFSNTYYFYKHGWRGINIDAMPGSMKAFKKARPRDINLELAVMESPAIATYYQFNDPALNGFSESLSLARDGLRDYVMERKIKIQGLPLSDILQRYMPINVPIDFMSIDVEGLDFQVLRSNNWALYRPKLVLIEILVSTLDSILHHEIHLYMKSHGYQLYAKTLNTVFFIENNYLTTEISH